MSLLIKYPKLLKCGFYSLDDLLADNRMPLILRHINQLKRIKNVQDSHRLYSQAIESRQPRGRTTVAELSATPINFTSQVKKEENITLDQKNINNNLLKISHQLENNEAESRQPLGKTTVSELSATPTNLTSQVKNEENISLDQKNININLLKTKFDYQLENNEAAEKLSIMASRRIDPTVVHQVFYFDTLALTKKLQSKGFTRDQAEGCAECLVEVINTTLDHQGRHMVTKPQKEVAVQQLMYEIGSVKKDMTLLQKTEFSMLKTDTEKIWGKLGQMEYHLNDEIIKLKGQFSLDINLERGRAIEAHAENEKQLQKLHNKIETDIANLNTNHEKNKIDLYKYVGGVLLTCVGFYVTISLRAMALQK